MGSNSAPETSRLSASLPISICRTEPDEHRDLTEVAFAAKRHWNYPEEYIALWKNELTISEAYIRNNVVYTVRDDEKTVGFYSLVENPDDFYAGEVLMTKGWWLEHMFIIPEYHRWGIGRQMVAHVKGYAAELKIAELRIFVDPFARGFYDHVGAVFLYDAKSSIPGRTIPVYALRVR